MHEVESDSTGITGLGGSNDWLIYQISAGIFLSACVSYNSWFVTITIRTGYTVISFHLVT